MSLKDRMKDNMSFIITMAMIISLAFGIYFYFEKRYALAEDTKAKISQTQEMVIQTNKRLEYKIMSDQARDIQQRIWILEDRFRGKVMDQTTLEEYRKLKETKEELNKATDEMRKSTTFIP